MTLNKYLDDIKYLKRQSQKKSVMNIIVYYVNFHLKLFFLSLFCIKKSQKKL